MSAAAAAAMAVAVAAAGPLEVGHKRVYFHTTTLQPIEPTAFDDCDSEDEDAPQWLRDHYQRKVEEFTDVNKVRILPYSITWLRECGTILLSAFCILYVNFGV